MIIIQWRDCQWVLPSRINTWQLLKDALQEGIHIPPPETVLVSRAARRLMQRRLARRIR